MNGKTMKAVLLDGTIIRVVQLNDRVLNVLDGTQPDLRGSKVEPDGGDLLLMSDAEFSLLTQAWSESARRAAVLARKRGSASSLTKEAGGTKDFDKLTPEERASHLSGFNKHDAPVRTAKLKDFMKKNGFEQSSRVQSSGSIVGVSTVGFKSKYGDGSAILRHPVWKGDKPHAVVHFKGGKVTGNGETLSAALRDAVSKLK